MVGLTISHAGIANALAAVTSPTFLRGEDGRVLGYFNPIRPAPEKLEPPISDEEIDRRANDPDAVWIPAAEIDAMMEEWRCTR